MELAEVIDRDNFMKQKNSVKKACEKKGDESIRSIIEAKLNLLIHSFEQVLYDDDKTFLKNMQNNNLAGDNINRYRYWEWTQGVGLFGLWKVYDEAKDIEIWNMLIKYYESQLKTGLPAKNINTTAPLLTLTYVYEKSGNARYETICKEWAKWLMEELPRTKEGGFQHITSDTLNEQELWDDTLFMAVLFLARMGKLLGIKEWIEEAKYQFLIHIKYLTDKKTGLWYHGWTFNGNHNFAEALWGRGNSWATIAIPELLCIIDCEESIKKVFIEALRRQIESLERFQHNSGMWHTLIDDETSYLEASATCGFGYGILLAVNLGLIDKKYENCALKALDPILSLVSEDGVVNQVSYGTAMGRETKQFYKEIEIKAMPYGQALAILFLLEATKTNI